MSNSKPVAFLSKQWASSTLIIKQIQNIVDSWNSIKDAQCKNEASETMIKRIRLNVDDLSHGVNSINALMEKWETEKTEEEKTRIMNRIRTKTTGLLGLYDVTDIKIKNLKRSIDASKEILMKQQQHQRKNMLDSGVHFFINLLQYVVSGEEAAITLKIEQGLVAALVLSNCVMYWIAKKELEIPRHINNEILNLTSDECKSAIDVSQKWIEYKDRVDV